jgi:hypothetical protein
MSPLRPHQVARVFFLESLCYVLFLWNGSEVHAYFVGNRGYKLSEISPVGGSQSDRFTRFEPHFSKYVEGYLQKSVGFSPQLPANLANR